MIKIKMSFVFFLGIVLYSGLLNELSNLFLTILIHEAGHLFFILLFKQKIKSVEFTGFGIFIKVSLSTNNILKKLLIFGGGILSNLIFILIIKSRITYDYHKIMIILNLIPIIPLDGFQMVNVLLSCFYEDEFINDVLFYVGTLILSLLLIFSLIFKITFFILLSLFLFIRLYKFRKTKKLSYLNNYLKLSF